MKQKTIVELQNQLEAQIKQITHSEIVKIQHFSETIKGNKRITGAFTEIAIPVSVKLKRWKVKVIAQMVSAKYDKVKRFVKSRGAMQYSGDKIRYQTIACYHE